MGIFKEMNNEFLGLVIRFLGLNSFPRSTQLVRSLGQQCVPYIFTRFLGLYCVEQRNELQCVNRENELEKID